MTILKFMLAMVLILQFIFEVERKNARPGKMLLYFAEVMAYLVIVTRG